MTMRLNDIKQLRPVPDMRHLLRIKVACTQSNTNAVFYALKMTSTVDLAIGIMARSRMQRPRIRIQPDHFRGENSK